ncbi:acyl-CoA--6-aminopenicillanic acid acyltransferase [Lentibacillus cibarius]|uniref:Acyl-CoA--6-aminopenicillanic acid acyltransferase n=1 Tax=Lentibacillus cibarius TaxID=2583219 RepID=A0A549YGL4_9BACI|nr:C45 family peptidase [Lentibacillus cibarius]TRM10977.1 acyl-CoA--6-aminopenicillanic acid acyltransferase [Lentibacillus cibarius]
MTKVHTDITQFRGSHYEFGYAQGTAIKDSLILKNRRDSWRIRKPRFETIEQDAKHAFMRFAPGIWEELLGMRDALGMPMTEVLRDFGHYRVNTTPSGCSILTGNDFMVRNYDYHPKTYDGRYSFFQPTDQGHAIIGPTSRVTGRMDGMNEHGLAMGYNFMQRRKPGDGFVCHMIGRIILETCATVDDAVQLLKEIPHRGSFSYIVLDRHEETYVIEASPRGVEARKSRACTNHFELLKHENRHHLDDSKRRLNLIQEQEGQISAHGAFRLMNDKDRGVFADLYKSWAGTIHTTAYFPKERKAWFALGGNQEPVIFDFASWLRGEDVAIKSVHGTLDTELGLSNAD